MAASAFSAGAAVAVVALAFALYALVEPRLGRAGAAATVAGVTTGLILLGGLMAALAARGPRRRVDPVPPEGPLERVMAFVREKPVLAGAAAIAAGLLAVRNPKYLGEAIRSFLDGRPSGR